MAPPQDDEPRTSSLTRGFSAIGGGGGGRKAMAEDFMKDVEDDEEDPLGATRVAELDFLGS